MKSLGPVLLGLLFITGPRAEAKSLCSERDQRRPYQDLRMGRLSDGFSASCTVTMISKSCAITAGHCVYYMYDKALVEFDVPLSDGKNIRPSAPQNRYRIDESSIVAVDKGYGRDWAILRLLPNEETKLLPGEVAGFYPVSFETPPAGTQVLVAGYGKVYDTSSDLYGTLQFHEGKILNIGPYQFVDPITGAAGEKILMLDHDVDTLGGNSGSVLIRQPEGDIVGIHTHGGQCGEKSGNRGTLVSQHVELQDAIRNCLRD